MITYILCVINEKSQHMLGPICMDIREYQK